MRDRGDKPGLETRHLHLAAENPPQQKTTGRHQHDDRGKRPPQHAPARSPLSWRGRGAGFDQADCPGQPRLGRGTLQLARAESPAIDKAAGSGGSPAAALSRQSLLYQRGSRGQRRQTLVSGLPDEGDRRLVQDEETAAGGRMVRIAEAPGEPLGRGGNRLAGRRRVLRERRPRRKAGRSRAGTTAGPAASARPASHAGAGKPPGRTRRAVRSSERDRTARGVPKGPPACR